MCVPVRQKLQLRWQTKWWSLKRIHFFSNLCFSNKWVSLSVTDNQKCPDQFSTHSSLIRQIWQGQCWFSWAKSRSNTRLNDDESRCDEDDTTDFERHQWKASTFWQHSFTLLRCATCTGICVHNNTHVYTETTNRHEATDTHAHQSLSLQLGILSLSLPRTNTQPLGWGNWMWQQILRGLSAGYQVNLWNVTHLAPAGWRWHLQETRLNHSSAKTGG